MTVSSYGAFTDLVLRLKAPIVATLAPHETQKWCSALHESDARGTQPRGQNTAVAIPVATQVLPEHAVVTRVIDSRWQLGHSCISTGEREIDVSVAVAVPVAGEKFIQGSQSICCAVAWVTF